MSLLTRRMFNKQVTLKTESSVDKYNVKTYTSTTKWSRFLGSTIAVYEDKEERTYYDKTVWLEADSTPTTNDMLNDGTRDYYITMCDPIYDDNNEIHHWQLAIR